MCWYRYCNYSNTNFSFCSVSNLQGIIFGLSDWCAQLIENGDSSDDDTDKSVATKNIVYSRIVMTFLVGLLFFGPAANAWYSMIFKVLPSTSLISTLKKAILGQVSRRRSKRFISSLTYSNKLTHFLSLL